MFLIIGLGNPGKQYDDTRHNFGFQLIDLLAGGEKFERKYESEFLKLSDLVLVKPQTFMNKSGEAVKEIAKFYPKAELVVIHDDIDLPLGTIRIQKNISAAGHNGVQNIIDELGTQNFTRIRLGIRNSKFEIRNSPEDYVLQKFSEEETDTVKEILLKAKEAADVLMTDGFEMAQSKFNG
jgi:PTH1 family peptidyl-tRNA hydrolase